MSFPTDGEEKALVHIVGAINYGASNAPSYINYYQANAYEVSELSQTQKFCMGAIPSHLSVGTPEIHFCNARIWIDFAGHILFSGNGPIYFRLQLQSH